MKILFLIDGLSAGGKERRLLELIKGLKTYPDIELYLVVFSDDIHYKEVFELEIPVRILKRVPKRNPMVFHRLFKLCKSWKPDLIHSWGSMSTIFAIPTSLLLNVKIVNGNIANAPNKLHFLDSRLLKAKFTFPFSEVIASNSKAGLKVYGVPKSKGVCIYNGFDTNRTTDLVDKSIIREKFNITTDKVIGMVGNFRGKKDYKTFIRVALIVMKQKDEVSFMAVGGGPELPEVKRMIPPGYTSRFIFTDLQKDVESIVNIFDVGVLATNTDVHGEGISNAILEYMALGKPTVATAGGGTNEAVVNEKTGFLVPPFSPEVMADKINHLLENPTVLREMGVAGKTRLQHTFSLEKMTTAFYDLYIKVNYS